VWENTFFSIEFCVDRTVHKFDFWFVTRETPNKRQLVFVKKACHATTQIYVFGQHIYMFSPKSCLKSDGTLPKLCRSTACSWVRQNTRKQRQFSETENLPWCKFIKSLQINNYLNYLNNNSCLIKCHRHHDGLGMYNQDEPTANRSQYVHIRETGTDKISGFFLYSYWCLDIF